MIISTTNNIQHFKISEYLGIVSGTDIYLVGGIFGGGLANQENLYTQALNNAISKMKRKATDLGANAIIGVSTNIVSPGNLNNIIVIATGTAVFAQQVENDISAKSSSVNTKAFVEDVHAIRDEEGTTKSAPTQIYMPQPTSQPQTVPITSPETSPQKAEASPIIIENSFSEGYWVCGKCKTKNLNTRNDCWSCGNPK